MGKSEWVPSVLLEALPRHMNPAASLLLVGRGCGKCLVLLMPTFNFMPACGCSSSASASESTGCPEYSFSPGSAIQAQQGSYSFFPADTFPHPPGRGRGLFTLSTLALAVIIVFER